MFEIIGKYNKAKIYASTLEDSAYKQILNMLNQKFVENSNISIMPDCHSGSGCVIGFTQTIENKVVPNLVGVDIGCGMLVTKISKDIGKEFFNKNGLEKLDKIIHEKIPSGMKHRDIIHPFANNINLKDIIADVNANKLLLSIGTLGGDPNYDYYEEDVYSMGLIPTIGMMIVALSFILLPMLFTSCTKVVYVDKDTNEVVRELNEEDFIKLKKSLILFMLINILMFYIKNSLVHMRTI